MKYYVYFDAYGHPRKAISEDELVETYRNSPDDFLRAMGTLKGGAERGPAAGQVGTLNFENEEELNDYLQSLGDEITGFYGCRSDSRPYNF